MFKGGLLNGGLNQLGSFGDDYQSSDPAKSNVWLYQNGGDVSLFSDGLSSCNGVGEKEKPKKGTDKTPMCLIADLARYNDVSIFFKNCK